jgi:integrase
MKRYTQQMSKQPVPPLWGAAIRGFCDQMTIAGLSPQTVRVRRELVCMVARRLPCSDPAAVTTGDLIALCAAHDWSCEYRRALRTALIGFYEHLGGPNPAAELPRVRMSPPRPRPVDDAAWDELLAAAPPREALMARLAAEAGLRRAEISRVRADDLISDRSGDWLIVHGKGDKQRIVALTDDLAAAIRNHRARGWLFPTPDGTTHLTARHVGALISALLPQGYSAHRLRHRYASRGFAATRNLLAVSAALGHSSVSTTQLYVAITRDDVRAVSEAAAAA